MFRRKDDIRTFIVIVSVCVICVLLGVILSYKNNYEKLVYVDEYNVYFANVNYINNFISKIAIKDNKSVYELLDSDYVNKNNIDINNVLEHFVNYSIHASFDAISMYYVQVKDNFIYYVDGRIYENGYDSERKLVDDKFSVVISIDNKNKCYSIYPIKNNYKNVVNSIKKVNINNNSSNKIEKSELVNKEQVCAIYLSDFINTIFYNNEEAYNVLSEDMKKIYIDSGEFEDYINKKFNLISTTADKCRLENIDDKRIYTVIDDNQNTYIFTEESIMNYKVDFYLKESE